MRRKLEELSSAGVTIETKVVADFDVGETPAGRVLGHTLPSSGRLTLKPLQDRKVDEVSYNPGRDNGPVVVNSGQKLVDALKQDPNLAKRRRTLHNQLGLPIVIDGLPRFLAFLPNKPNRVPKPKKSPFPGRLFKYTFETSLVCDDTCRPYLHTDRDLINCVNLCLQDYQLGQKHRCLRDGRLELLHHSKSLSWSKQLQKATSNVLDPARTILGVAAEATAAIPPASAACKGLVAMIGVGTTIKDNRTRARIELQRVKELSEKAVSLLQRAENVQEKESLKRIVSTCQNLESILQSIVCQDRLGGALRLNRNKDALQEIHLKLDVAEQNFADTSASLLLRLSKTAVQSTLELQRGISGLADQNSTNASLSLKLNQETAQNVLELQTFEDALFRLFYIPGPSY